MNPSTPLSPWFFSSCGPSFALASSPSLPAPNSWPIMARNSQNANNRSILSDAAGPSSTTS
ncbi:Uncharacterised protein [Mycobacteroides abscessus subsp. massiliense]|nr:Uncharacterised protein [Mycobacteroides abscessus subsp. massiliense]